MAFGNSARQPAQCLMFHRIGELDSALGPNAPKDAVSKNDFERIIKNVASHRTPISLSRFVDGLNNNTVPENAVVVTFDDGFRDNLTHALPILEEYGVPATVFAATGFVGRTTVPYQYVLADAVAQTDNLAFHWNGHSHCCEHSTAELRQQSYSTIYRMLRPLPSDTRAELLALIIPDAIDCNRWKEMYLTWDELRELADSEFITVGAHTHNHVLLNTVSTSVVTTEATTCRSRLEQHLGKSIRHFSYPHGGHRWSVRRTIRSLGFESAVAVDHRSGWSGQRYQIQRTCASNQLKQDPHWQPFQ